MSVFSWLPGLQAVRSYQRRWLAKDVVAGVVLTTLLVPQGMAYAELAGLPPITGLYTSILCLLGYAVFGPSRILVLGPDSSLGPMIAATILPLMAAGGDPERAVALASLLAIMVAAIMIVAAVARLGFIADLISKPTMIGYMNGLALTILIGQLPKLFGFRSARVIGFGASNVAPAGAVVGGLVIVVSYAGFASPLVVIVALVASLCCASSIAEFARRLPSAGSLYTYNSHGLGRTGGFLTGWMMVFAYALYVPAGLSLTSAYASQLVADTLHVAIDSWVLFVVILGAVVLVAYLGVRTSSSVDLVLVAGEVAVIAALAVTILIKIAPDHYSAAVLSPASSPNGQFTGITNAMIYGITAFAGFEAAASLGEEARNTRRSIPASTIGVVIVTGVFYLLVVVAEAFGVGPDGLAAFTRQGNPLGYLTSRYWSPSALWAIDLVVVLTGLGFVVASLNVAIRVLFAMGREGALPGSLARLSSRHTPVVSIACVAALALALGLPLTYAVGGARTFRYLAGAGGLSVVLVYLAVNISAIRAFRTEFRDEFRPWRHLLLPATAAVLMLFPLWGILRPRARTLVDLLPFAALGWLCLGAIAAGVLRARRPASFETLGRVFTQPADNNR